MAALGGYFSLLLVHKLIWDGRDDGGDMDDDDDSGCGDDKEMARPPVP